MSSCNLCPPGECTQFTPIVDGDHQSRCFCGHDGTAHGLPPPRILPPRGGLPARNCFAFAPLSGGLINDFRQQCRCGGGYNQHHPLPASSQPVNPLPRTMGPPAPPRPAPLDRSSVSPATFPQSTLPNVPIYQPPPATQVITPYMRTFGNISSTSGVPQASPPLHTVNGTSRTRNRTVSSRRPYPATQIRNRASCQVQIQLVMLPHDLKELPDGVLDIFDQNDVLHTPAIPVYEGEELATRLRTLSRFKCSRRFTLSASRASDVVVDQMHRAVHDMAQEGSLEFPPYEDLSFDLAADEENRETRLLYAHLPFRFLKPSNRSRSSRSLHINSENSWNRCTFSNISQLAKRVADPSGATDGILFLCPKDGPIKGPIPDVFSAEKHLCFAERLLHYLHFGTKGPITCRAGCPETTSSLFSPAAVASNSSLPSPSLSRLSLSPLIRPCSIQVTGPSSVHGHSGPLGTLISGPADRPPASTAYQSPDLPEFNSFSDISVLIRQQDVWRIQGNSVNTVARGLLAYIRQFRVNPNATFQVPNDLELALSVQPPDIRLDEIWGYHWIFKAGNTADSLGDGVTREVLDTALQMICRQVSDYDTRSDDGYIQVMVPEFASAEDEDNAFALGVLVKMILLRSWSAPLPLSPAFLQAVIGGPESLNDPSWLEAILPNSWSTLRLFPSSRSAIQHQSSLSSVDHNRLRTLLYLVEKQSLAELASVRDTQWPSIVQRIQTSYLLGVRPREILESAIYSAFRDGFDQAFSSTCSSFIKLISDSSKSLLYNVYSAHRSTSPVGLIDRLVYQSEGDGSWALQSRDLLTSLKAHLERYLKGVGHPAGGEYEMLVGLDQYQRDNNDTNYRTRRFIKMTSGLNVFRQVNDHFHVILCQDIPSGASFGTHLDANNDLLPLAFHACTMQVEFWANDALKTVLNTPPPVDTTTVTAFDTLIHNSLIEAGMDDFNA